MNKKLGFWMLFLILFSSMAFAYGTITTGAWVSTSLYSQDPVKVEPGNYVELRFKLENKGGDTLEEFEVELVPEFPFSLDSSEPALKKYGSMTSGINGDDGLIAKWKVRVDDDAIEGDNDIQLRYRFKGNEWIYSDFEVSVDTQETIINIKEIKTVPENVMPGEQFDLKILVANEADSALRNMKFKLDSSVLVTIGSTDEKYVKVLNSGDEQEIIFNLISQGDASEVLYNVPLTISYYDNEGTMDTKDVSFGLVLIQEPTLIKGIDRTEVVTSGDKGSVSIMISNIGIDEIKFVELIAKDSEDYKVFSTKHVYLGNVDSDDFETADFDIYVKSDKESVPLMFELKYKDSLNKEYVEDVELSLDLFSTSEAQKLGLKPAGNPVNSYIGFVVMIFVFIFWLMMLFDLIQKKMPRYKKLIWIVILVLTTLFGAVLYYFTARKK